MRKFSSILASLAFLLVAIPAHAHFIWISVEQDSEGKPAVHLWFAELAEPDDAKLIEKITHSQAWLHEHGKPAVKLELKTVVADRGGSLVARVDAKSPYSATATCKYGVIERGGKTFLLNYYAKYLTADEATLKVCGRAENLPLDVVPSTNAQGYDLEVLWKGKVAANAEVTVSTPDAKQEKYTTDAAGKVKLHAKLAGLYSIRAKHVEEVSGKEDGKDYGQISHYSTLTLRRAAAADSAARPASK